MKQGKTVKKHPLKRATNELGTMEKNLHKINKSLNVISVKLDECEGKITRQKQKKNKLEQSIIDYFVVCQEFFFLVTNAGE